MLDRTKIPEILQEKTSDVSEFFKKLGYEVTWDYNSSGRWWEISDFLQIDMGIPLTAILQDFCCFLEGKSEGTSGYDYQVNVRPGHQKNFNDLLEKTVGESIK